MRHLTLAATLLLATAALAAPPRPAAEAAPIPLTVRVTSGDASAAPLLAGQLAVRPHHATTVEHRAARGPEQQSLTLEASPLDDGRISVRALWMDRTAEGAEVKWQPAVAVKRGVEVQVRLDYPGGSRLLVLTAG